jgi:hypothetical protein
MTDSRGTKDCQRNYLDVLTLPAGHILALIDWPWATPVSGSGTSAASG